MAGPYRAAPRRPDVCLIFRVPGEYLPRATWATPRAALLMACELAYHHPDLARSVATDALQAAASGHDCDTVRAARALLGVL